MLSTGVHLVPILFEFFLRFSLKCSRNREHTWVGGVPTDDISVIVKATGKDTNSRKTATVTLDPEMSIREVKQRITGVMRLPDMGSSDDPDIRIILAGRELDDRVTVGECDLGNQVSQLPHCYFCQAFICQKM